MTERHCIQRVAGQVGITLDGTWAIPENRSDLRDVQASSRFQDWTLGWFLHPLVYGDYPPALRAKMSQARFPNVKDNTPPSILLSNADVNFIKGLPVCTCSGIGAFLCV